MELRVVQTFGSRTGAPATSFGQAVSGITPGNLLAVITYTGGSSAMVINDPTDNVGNTYASLTATTWTATFHALARIAYVTAATAPSTITAHTSATCDIAIVVFEIAAADPQKPLDTDNNTLSSSASPAAGAITTTESTAILIAGLTHDGLATTITPPTGFTPGPEDETVTFAVYSSAYQIVTDVQTAFNPTWTLASGSRDADVAIAAFRAAGRPQARSFQAIPFMGAG